MKAINHTYYSIKQIFITTVILYQSDKFREYFPEQIRKIFFEPNPGLYRREENLSHYGLFQMEEVFLFTQKKYGL